jgi:hypothetical protein
MTPLEIIATRLACAMLRREDPVSRRPTLAKIAEDSVTLAGTILVLCKEYEQEYK